MLPLVPRFGEHSKSGRNLARWSARVLAASLLLAGLMPIVARSANIFDSLANQLRDAAICAARVPWWLSILLLVVAFRLIVGALWVALGQDVSDMPSGANLNEYQALVAKRMTIYEVWTSSEFRSLRRKLIWGAFVLAILSGIVSVSFTAWVLPRMSSFWSWILIAVVSFAVTQVEKSGTERLYARHAPVRRPPNRVQITDRLASYVEDYPTEAPTASPLLYAYSTLNRQQLRQRFTELGAGAPAWVSRLIVLAVVALVYPHVPAPNIEPLGRMGFIGCTYTDLYGFFRLTQENLPLAIAAIIVLLAFTPLTVLLTYTLFMIEWKFPLQVQVEVLRREQDFAKRMVVYQPVVATAWAIVIMVLLWVSAWLATWLQAPIAGLLVLIVPGMLVSRLFIRQ